MEVRHGTQRTVVAFPGLGLAIKIARIRPIVAAKCFLKEAVRPREWKGLKMRFTHPMDHVYTFKSMLLGGLASNATEFVFYATTRHRMAQPTYFSLFGFVNVAKYSKPCRPNDDICLRIGDITGHRALNADLHHLGNPRNFTTDGGVRILDYGSSKVRAFIRTHGDKVLDELEP